MKKKESRNRLKALEWWHVSVCPSSRFQHSYYLQLCLDASPLLPSFPRFQTQFQIHTLYEMAYSIGKPINTSTVVFLTSLHGNEVSVDFRLAACQVSHHPWIQNGSQPKIREGTTLWLMESLLMRTRVWILRMHSNISPVAS